MKKFNIILLFLLLICVPARFVFSFDVDAYPGKDLTPSIFSRGVKQTAAHRLIGTSETLLSIGITMGFNIAYNTITTGSASWAIPTAESINNNLTPPWRWEDTDGFKVNQIGHPLQGSLYYNSGRVNGFNFYESVFFNAFGGAVWEIFCETNDASINDLITTTTGALTIGEISYRLYLEACAAGVPAPIAFLLNPVAGVHRILTGWEPPGSGGNIHTFNAHIGTAYVQNNYSTTGGNRDLFSFRGPVTDIDLSLIYGNPFDQQSRIPFNHFEFAFSLGTDFSNYMGIRFISDAYLFSFCPVYSDVDQMSTGLSLHMDALSLGSNSMDASSSIDQYSNALDWTIKYQHLFFPDVAFQTKFHFGFTFMGAASFYSPDLEIDLRNYGYGLNSKVSFNLEHKRLGNLAVSAFGYVLWGYPGTSASSEGRAYWLFNDVTYSHYVSKHLSVGIGYSLAMEWGLYSKNNFPDIQKSDNAVKLFLTWNL